MRGFCAKMVVAGAVFGFFLPYTALAVDCGQRPFVITTQADANGLFECMERKAGISRWFNGDVVFSQDVRGEINMTAYEFINGSITVENVPLLQKLYMDRAPSEWCCRMVNGRAFKGITLRNLTSLYSFGYAIMTSYKEKIVLRDLPLLEEFYVKGVDWIGGELALVNLPRLTDLSGIAGPRGWITPRNGLTIHNVPLRSVDVFLNIMDHFTMKLHTRYVIDGIPNVQQAAVSSPAQDGPEILDFTGNGNVSMIFNCTSCDILDSPRFALLHEFPDLRLSGLSSLSRNRAGEGAIETLNVGAFRVTNNTFTTLPLDFDGLNSLCVENNPNLETILFNITSGNYNWDEIVIVGNPRLRLKSANNNKGTNSTALSPTFYWPMNDTLAMVFDGLFDNEFFQPLIDLHPNVTSIEERGPRVLNRFIVKSSLGPDQFNCSQLNELRKRGVLKGEYSCQGETVPDLSGVGRVVVPGLGIAFVAFSMAWGFLGAECGFGFW